MAGWFVVKTKNQQERWACENIERQGAEPYLPKIAERVKRKRGLVGELRIRCLFPSYVFVKTAGQWRFLLGTFGVVSVIMQGNSPALLPDSEIVKLRARENKDGLIVLPDRPHGITRFKKDSPVRVTDGAFSGCVGLYQGAAPQERQRVLLDFLGRKTAVLIADEFLEKA